MPKLLAKKLRKPLDARFDQPANTTCTTLKEVGDVLRTRRKELGWSQRFAAQAAQMNQRLVSEMERGLRGVAFDRVAEYAETLGVDIVLHIRGKS